MTAPRFVRVVLMLLGCLGVSGCLSVSPLPKTYLLSMASPPPPDTVTPVVVGVGPISIPAYLDRPPIVVRSAEGGEVALAGEHRWAEPLQDGIPRIIVGNLSAMIPTDAVLIFPWRSSWTVQYRVTVDVLRFDGTLGGPVVLDARWRLLDGVGKELARRAVHFAEPSRDGTYGALVSAHDRVLASLSHAIATEIRARLR